MDWGFLAELGAKRGGLLVALPAGLCCLLLILKGGHAARFLARAVLSDPCRVEVAEGQAGTGEPWGELLAGRWRISTRGFWSSQHNREVCPCPCGRSPVV